MPIVRSSSAENIPQAVWSISYFVYSIVLTPSYSSSVLAVRMNQRMNLLTDVARKLSLSRFPLVHRWYKLHRVHFLGVWTGGCHLSSRWASPRLLIMQSRKFRSKATILHIRMRIPLVLCSGFWVGVECRAALLCFRSNSSVPSPVGYSTSMSSFRTQNLRRDLYL
jgi:hypothetical protein